MGTWRPEMQEIFPQFLEEFYDVEENFIFQLSFLIKFLQTQKVETVNILKKGFIGRHGRQFDFKGFFNFEGGCAFVKLALDFSPLSP